MVSFDSFCMDDGSPIYMQIIMHIKRGIVAGVICKDDEMPSRRVLSALLGVNPNTVQKAYSLLEDEGIVKSRSGAKSYIALEDDTPERLRGELLENNVNSFIQAMRRMGISKGEAQAAVNQYWSEE